MYKTTIRIFLLICILQINFYNEATGQIEDRWRTYAKTSDKAGKVNILMSIADQYYLEDELQKRDSVFLMAADIAKMENSDTLEVKIYQNYFQLDDFPF